MAWQQLCRLCPLIQNQSPRWLQIPKLKKKMKKSQASTSRHSNHYQHALISSPNTNLNLEKLYGGAESYQLKKTTTYKKWHQRKDWYIPATMDWNYWLHHPHPILQSWMEHTSLQVLVWGRPQTLQQSIYLCPREKIRTALLKTLNRAAAKNVLKKIRLNTAAHNWYTHHQPKQAGNKTQNSAIHLNQIELRRRRKWQC